ncbi:hypothetical protein L9F63_000513, partial [Diploptera punctata]
CTSLTSHGIRDRTRIKQALYRKILKSQLVLISNLTRSWIVDLKGGNCPGKFRINSSRTRRADSKLTSSRTSGWQSEMRTRRERCLTERHYSRAIPRTLASRQPRCIFRFKHITSFVVLLKLLISEH